MPTSDRGDAGTRVPGTANFRVGQRVELTIREAVTIVALHGETWADVKHEAADQPGYMLRVRQSELRAAPSTGAPDHE
jgi:hypothetical protein